MAVRIDELLQKGERVFYDSSVRGRELGFWMGGFRTFRTFDKRDINLLQLVKQAILTEFNDHQRDNVFTVSGVLNELKDYANSVRKKRLDLEKRNREVEIGLNEEVIAELKRIHTGILMTAEQVKQNVYDSTSQTYKSILETVRGQAYSVLSQKIHRRETDINLVTATIHSSEERPTHVISTDMDITKLIRKYFSASQIPPGISCYYVTSSQEAVKTIG
jgi:hypothetical protein